MNPTIREILCIEKSYFILQFLKNNKYSEGKKKKKSRSEENFIFSFLPFAYQFYKTQTNVI